MRISTHVGIPGLDTRGGGRPTLNLNFVGADRLDPQITFTRASTATYFNSAGVLTSANSNIPRFDYDPATLAARGLLIEEQRTNLEQYSEDFTNVFWTVSNATVSGNATVAPNGTTTADKLVTDNTLTGGQIFATTTMAASTAFAFSVFAKASEWSWTRLTTRGPENSDIGAYFNLSTGVVGTVDAGVTASIQAVGSGWYRCTIVRTTGTGAAGSRQRVYSTNADNTLSTGNGTSGIFIWGAQLEAGAFPTSYIPTTTTALTRNADVASVNTLSPWYNASEGTIYVDFAGRQAGIQPYLTMFSNTGETERIYQRYVGAQYQTIARVAGVDIANVYNSTEGSAVNAKIASAYNASQLATSTNGQAVTGFAVASLSSVPSGLNRLWLGSFAGVSAFANGYLRRITYYPRRLSNAELQAITA